MKQPLLICGLLATIFGTAYFYSSRDEAVRPSILVKAIKSVPEDRRGLIRTLSCSSSFGAGVISDEQKVVGIVNTLYKLAADIESDSSSVHGAPTEQDALEAKSLRDIAKQLTRAL